MPVLYRLAFSCALCAVALAGPASDRAAAQDFGITFQPTELVEPEVTSLVDVTLTVGTVAGGTPAPGVLCIPLAVSYSGTASPDDVWLGSGSIALADRQDGFAVVVPVTLDAEGTGTALVPGLVVVADDLVEDAEGFSIVVGLPRLLAAGQACAGVPVVEPVYQETAFLLLDDDGVLPLPLLSGPIELFEADQDFVPLLSVAFEDPVEAHTCLPYVLDFQGGNASAADVRLVSGPSERLPLASGWFVARAGYPVGVSEHLLIVADGLVEPPETFSLRFYAPQEMDDLTSTCSPDGPPVQLQPVVIVDDDGPVSLGEITVESVVAGTVFEGDPGDGDVPVHLLVRFQTAVVEPFALVYGSQETGSASDRDVQFIDREVVTVSPGVLGTRLLVAHIVPDDLPEGNEEFLAWLEVEGFPSTRREIVVTIGNDDIAGDELLTVRLVGVDGLEVTEGDPAPYRGLDPPDPCRRDWHCIPLELGLAARQTEDVVYELNILAGTADPHQDYVPFEGVRLFHHEGHLRTYDLSVPLRLEVRRDYVVEAPETFYLVIHQVIDGGDQPLLSWMEQITIVDDDGALGPDGQGVGVWFGTGDDAVLCPAPSPRLFPLVEPVPDQGIALHRLTLAMRLPAGATAGAVACAPADAGKPVDYRFQLLSSSGQVGVDLALAGAAVGDRLRFQNGVAHVDVAVFSDGLVEPLETVLLELSSGTGPVVTYSLLVADYETTFEVAGSRLATAARYARLLASDAVDALADRFSCAASDACARADSHLRPGLMPPRSGLSRTAPQLLTSLLGGLASAGLARGSISPTAPSQSILGDHLPQPSSGFGASVPVLHPVRAVGPALDGVRFQGDPGRWLGTSRIAGAPAGAGAWSFWGRTGYQEAFDQASTGRSLRTSLLSFTGGIDRAVGRLRLGWLQSYVLGVGQVGLHESARPFAIDIPDRATSWHVMGPYVGVQPDRRFRLWAAPLWFVGSDRTSLGPLDVGLELPGFGMTAFLGGGSVSLLRTVPFVLDLEADVFSVAVGDAGMPDADFLDLPDASAGRSRVAVRIGLPLGDPDSVQSRLVVRVARRWDTGTDMDWVWGGLRPYQGWVGAGVVSATDLTADYRFRRRNSSLSLTLTGGLQFQGETPAYPPAAGLHNASVVSRRLRLAAAVRWGLAGRSSGWTASVRPAFGRPAMAMPQWWDAASVGPAAYLPSLPLLDAEVGYAFPDRSRLTLTAQRFFGGSISVPRVPASHLSALVRFQRTW